MNDVEPTADDRELAEKICDHWEDVIGADVDSIATLIARDFAAREAGWRVGLTDKLVDASMTIPDEVDRKREKLTVAFARIFSKAAENTP